MKAVFRPAMGIAVAWLSLGAMAPVFAQTHDHSGAAGTRGVPGRGGIGELLKAGDASLRAIEKTVQGGEGLAIRERVAEFVALADALGAHFVADDPLSPKDVERARRTLERQARRLDQLGSQASSETREALEAAFDASQRALDAVEAAPVATAPASSSSGHHRGSSRGCGQH